MDGDDPSGQIEHVDLGEARVRHQRGKRFLVGMTADRFGEVTIGRRIARDARTEPREHAELIQIV
jgi:hypothetical protein